MNYTETQMKSDLWDIVYKAKNELGIGREVTNAIIDVMILMDKEAEKEKEEGQTNGCTNTCRPNGLGYRLILSCMEETGACIMLTEILLCSIVTLPLVLTIYENNIRIISK